MTKGTDEERGMIWKKVKWEWWHKRKWWRESDDMEGNEEKLMIWKEIIKSVKKWEEILEE